MMKNIQAVIFIKVITCQQIAFLIDDDKAKNKLHDSSSPRHAILKPNHDTLLLSSSSPKKRMNLDKNYQDASSSNRYSNDYKWEYDSGKKEREDISVPRLIPKKAIVARRRR
jgi:hypothetical protein